MDNLCVISHIANNEDPVKPVIVNFENGTVEPGKENSLLYGYYENDAKELQVAAATENMVYSGAVKSKDLYNTYIAICNKKKTKMRLVAVDYVTLSPKLIDSNEVQNRSIEALDSTSAQLSKQFGSKTVKRKIEQRERMKMDIENVKEELERTVADIKVNPAETNVLKVESNDTDYKPHINRDAQIVGDVYNLNDTVSEDVLKSTSAEVQRILADEDPTLGESTSFVTLQIKNLIKSTTADKEPSLQLFLYIDCLIKFMLKHAKEISNKSFLLCRYSKLVQDDILQRYTIVSGKSRLRPNSMKDKCLCSILVLSMIACHYQLDLVVIAKELKLGLRKVQDVSRVLGFTVNKGVAVLSLPLPSAVNRFVNKRKRK